MAIFTGLRGALARPMARLVVGASCVGLIVGLSILIARQMTADDPAARVAIPAGYDLSCDACGHEWHIGSDDWRTTFDGEHPSPKLAIVCPQCGKRAGYLLDPCPWCQRPLPRHADTRICPRCHKDPDAWRAPSAR